MYEHLLIASNSLGKITFSWSVSSLLCGGLQHAVGDVLSHVLLDNLQQPCQTVRCMHANTPQPPPVYQTLSRGRDAIGVFRASHKPSLPAETCTVCLDACHQSQHEVLMQYTNAGFAKNDVPCTMADRWRTGETTVGTRPQRGRLGGGGVYRRYKTAAGGQDLQQVQT